MKIPRDELYQLYHIDDMLQREISELYDVTPSMVSICMSKYHIKTTATLKSELINSKKPSKEDLEEMYYNKKIAPQEIAKSIGVSTCIVNSWIKSYGIKTRTLSEAMLVNSTKPSKSELEKMYYDMEMTMGDIAYEFDVCKTTVFKWIKSYGIESRPRSVPGEKHPSWKNGISFIPYCHKFNNVFKESIRKRDDYTCQLCQFEQKLNGRKLDVHHIHYDKENCEPDVVILCRSCNARVNINRDYWEKFFEDQLEQRGLLRNSLSQEIDNT